MAHVMMTLLLACTVLTLSALLNRAQAEQQYDLGEETRHYESVNWKYNDETNVFTFQCDVTYEAEATNGGGVYRKLHRLGGTNQKMGSFRLADRCYRCGKCSFKGVWCHFRYC